MLKMKHRIRIKDVYEHLRKLAKEEVFKELNKEFTQKKDFEGLEILRDMNNKK
jgi:hypothetical protein|tara:strand:- start:162 stop:320 length:159 start_codon:yes stop_codon:yes gene_type:complete